MRRCGADAIQHVAVEPVRGGWQSRVLHGENTAQRLLPSKRKAEQYGQKTLAKFEKQSQANPKFRSWKIAPQQIQHAACPRCKQQVAVVEGRIAAHTKPWIYGVQKNFKVDPTNKRYRCAGSGSMIVQPVPVEDASGVNKIGSKRSNQFFARPESTWRCPKCGAVQSDKIVKCYKCGEAHPTGAKDAYSYSQHNVKKCPGTFAKGGCEGKGRPVTGHVYCAKCERANEAQSKEKAKDASGFVPYTIPMNYREAAQIAAQEMRRHQSEGRRLQQVSGSLKPEVQRAAQAHFNAVGSWNFVAQSLRLNTDEGEETAEELWPSAYRASNEADKLTDALGSLHRAKDAVLPVPVNDGKRYWRENRRTGAWEWFEPPNGKFGEVVTIGIKDPQIWAYTFGSNKKRQRVSSLAEGKAWVERNVVS